VTKIDKFPGTGEYDFVSGHLRSHNSHRQETVAAR
jgi:hypothetical protein